MRRGLVGVGVLVVGALALSFTRCGGVLGVRAMGGGVLPTAELVTGGGDASTPLPLLVALHGRGSDHERFLSTFAGLTTAARVVSIGAPIVESGGRAWFTFGRGWGGALDDTDACVPRILETIDAVTAEHPVAGRPLVVGFSQGAMLAYVLALRHPDRIGAAFPVSGVSFGQLEPDTLVPETLPPIHAFHGTNDEVIGIEHGRETLEHLRGRGVTLDLTEVPGATHWIGTEMSAVLLPALDAALAHEAAR